MAQTLIPELPDTKRDPMRREMNRGLAVAFINADLTGRAHLDVRSGIALYDDAGIFEALIDPKVWESFTAHESAVRALQSQNGIAFWSKGI